jgi:hypothetical protein
MKRIGMNITVPGGGFINGFGFVGALAALTGPTVLARRDT